MKVALHIGQLLQPVPGGIARYARALAKELPRHGIDVEAFAAGPRPKSINGAYTDLGWPNGSIRYEAWNRFRWPTVKVPGDLVHAPSLAVPPVRNRPLVVTAHDIAFHRFPNTTTARGRAFHERGLAHARKHATLVIAPSQFTQYELYSLGFRADQVDTAYLGTDPVEPMSDSEVDRRLAAVEQHRPFLLTVGTVEPRKRLPLLVKAHQQVRSQLPNLELLIVGPSGWGDVGVLEAPGVRRMGQLPWTVIDALYRRALACAIPSVYEGFGLPAVEAMSRGCPTVVVRGSATEEIVGAGGLRVPADDPEALAEALHSLIFDAGRRDRVSRAGIERSRAFTWSTSVQRHAVLYRHVLQRHAQTG